jgi:Outer membrane protein/protective antigen OMA87
MLKCLKYFLFALLVSAVCAAPEEEKPARFKISGLGLFRNREVSRLMSDFINPGKVAHLSDDAAENAAFVLISELEDDGYHQPRVRARVTRLDGTSSEFSFDQTLDLAFPREPGTHVIEFDVERGPRSYIAEVHFHGLTALKADEAEKLFQPAYGLWQGKRANVFSDSVLRRGRNTLLEMLLLQGYSEARVEVRSSPLPEPEAAMRLDVTVHEGPRWMVRSFAVVDPAQVDANVSALQGMVGQPWSDAIRQDASVATRRAYYRLGYPDVTVRVRPTPAPVTPTATDVAATAEVAAGPHVTIGEISFEGNARTRTSVIKRRLRVDPGDPLDPTALERARLRLGRLSAFRSVETRTEPDTGDVRDVVFVFEEADPWDASVLFGYGSYEQLRGGVELRRSNLWGRAHQDRVFAVQSMKSTRGDYTYTVPEIFGESIDGSLRLFGLRRDERSFRREEYGGTIQFRKRFGGRGPEVSAGYTFETLRDTNNTLATQPIDERRVNSANIHFTATLDRRDQAINPKRGYRLFLRTEFASKKLGGEVDYQRFEWGAAHHIELTPERWIHAGISQGAIFTLGASPYEPPPVNKLYYPGGENSVRGYGDGEASPRAADGAFLGAKTYTVLNLEFEQALTQQWSLVLFSDYVVAAARLGDYPGDKPLGSIGLGLRYRTIIGPIRVEYGRNINPRAQDPGGTWHVSVGYPF